MNDPIGVIVAFAMYCDEKEMSQEQGEELAEKLADDLMSVAVDRRDYLPDHLKRKEDDE